MHKVFMMGNEAIAMGAVAAGVNVVAGYPGTPSTEVLETVAKNRGDDCYIEWSVNEKAAMELVTGAAYSGARTLVTMKQMGLNVAADPLMCARYIGVKGGMVVLVADDPGPISSQTEQDTRHFAAFSKVPCFDPTSAKEAYEMIQEAFEYSEKYNTPVFFRPTTRVCHGYASIEIKDKVEYYVNKPEGFIKDKKWVIFPKLSYANHLKIGEQEVALAKEFSEYKRNEILNKNAENKKAIATSGISFTYVAEALEKGEKLKTFKVATPYPFPEQLALEFLEGVDEVLCVEELDPVVEDALVYVAGKYNLKVKILGKRTGDVKAAGENTRDSVKNSIDKFLGIENEIKGLQGFEAKEAPELPVRPPVLCAGCPHRASFYAVKEAMKGEKTLYAGDIGCYTLGNAMPLDMVDTCLCMGAGVNMAQGIGRIEPDTKCFAFVGDSTFFASAITGVVNAIYNQADMTLVVLDNSTTAMTGHQPHPGTGHTMMGDVVDKVSIEAVLKGCGVKTVKTVDPLDQKLAIETVKEVANEKGVKAIIFKSPCVAIVKPNDSASINDKCINCKKCIRELGCPALITVDGKVAIDKSLCTGCGLCKSVCPTSAIQCQGGKLNE